MQETQSQSTVPVSPIEKPNLSKLKAALAKAQMEIFNPVKNREVSVEGKEGRRGFGYEYAELNVVTEIIRIPLAKNGLTYTQTVEKIGDKWAIVTTLMHGSGEEKDFFYPLITTDRAGMKNEQIFASGFTYGKRQALKGIFGIADDTEDKDAQDGDPNVKISPKPPAKKSPPPPKQENKAKSPASNEPPPTFPDELDRALDQRPPEQEEPITLLDQIVMLAEAKKVPHEKMKEVIKLCIGREARAKELNTEELTKVIDYVGKFL